MGINKLGNLYHRNYIEYIWDFSFAHPLTTLVAFSPTFPRSWPAMGPSVIREDAWHGPFLMFLRRISNSFCISFDALQPPHPLASPLPLLFSPSPGDFLGLLPQNLPTGQLAPLISHSATTTWGCTKKCHLPQAGVSGPLLSPPGPLLRLDPSLFDPLHLLHVVRQSSHLVR